MVSHLFSCDDFSVDCLHFARSLAVIQEEPLSCFQFVISVLEKSSPFAYQELLEVHKALLNELPEEHQTPLFIPYYYSLLPFEHLKYLRKVEIPHIQPGDLFIYIDRDYNPDPSCRATNASSGTHISIVDSVMENNGIDYLRLKLIDSSKRRRGRCLIDQESIPSELHQIAYSFSDVLFNPESNLWDIQFKAQKPYPHKHIFFLRILQTAITEL